MSSNIDSSKKDHLPDSSVQDADALIAQQLNQMSCVDREKALFDIHGVAESRVAETPELVARSLEEFDAEVKKTREKSAYETAVSQDPNFASDRLFRLKYLRSTNFDPIWAASKFVRFFEVKQELFGMEKLTTTITLDDLDPDSVKSLESGFCTILPLQDRAGRAILCWTQQLLGTSSLLSTVRCYI